jgi:hypothetical protein
MELDGEQSLIRATHATNAIAPIQPGSTVQPRTIHQPFTTRFYHYPLSPTPQVTEEEREPNLEAIDSVSACYD